MHSVDANPAALQNKLNRTFYKDETYGPNASMSKTRTSNVIRQYLESVRSYHPQDSFGQIRQKLAYEWKNIYRALCQKESYTLGNGNVTVAVFQKALSDHQVNLSKQEMAVLLQKFQESNGVVSYCKLSKMVGLHNNTVEMIRETKSIL